MNDEFYMNQAITLARKGLGKVNPNPCVGAIIVKDGQILSRGYHARFGGYHAEIEAISKLSPDKLKNATLYVNLEPCTHYGKTPPCTDAILRTGIRKVVIGMIDPNPVVHGKGIRKLKQHGIEVKTSVLKKKCEELNEVYIKCLQKKRPFVILKIAQTLDGKIAVSNGLSRWITSPASRSCVHRMRNENDAILVGINTLIQDDPELTVRWGKGKHIKKIVLDSRLRIQDSAKILSNKDPENTILVTTPNASAKRINALKKKGVEVWILNENRTGQVDLNDLWDKCFIEHIYSILVEGGKGIFTSVLKSGEADRIVLFTAPKLFGEGISAFGDLNVSKPDSAFKFRSFRWQKCGPDMVFDGRF